MNKSFKMTGLEAVKFDIKLLKIVDKLEAT